MDWGTKDEWIAASVELNETAISTRNPMQKGDAWSSPIAWGNKLINFGHKPRISSTILVDKHYKML